MTSFAIVGGGFAGLGAAVMLRREGDQDLLRAALGKTMWHTHCTNWYVDENGNDPNQWPWLWSTHRRRTAQIPAGTYKLATA